MNAEFVDEEDIPASLRAELERKKQKKLEKQERLNRKKQLIESMKNCLKQDLFQEETDFSECLRAASNFSLGSIEWALAFFGVNREESLQRIKQIYLKRAQLWHPDKNNGKAESRAMQLLNEAWFIVKNSNL